MFIEFTYNTVIFFLLIKIWVFGMIERDTNKVILYPVEKRDEATLLPLILKHVEPGSSAKSYRMIANLNRQLEAKNTLMKKWKRRYYRQVNDDNPTTPRSKAKKMLRECRVTPYVQKQLILHNAVIEQIRKKYQETRECKVKSLLRRTVANVHKKYRLMHKVSKQIGVNQTLITQDCGKYLTYQRKTRSDKTDETTKRKIVAFFERDDNSRMLPERKTQSP